MAKVQSLDVKADIWELLGAGVLKYFEEKLLSGIIGNGTYMSGAVKLGIGMLLDNFRVGGKFGDMIKTAFVIDGVEDIAVNIGKMAGGLFNIRAPGNNTGFDVI